MNYCGAEKIIEPYGAIDPVKAALARPVRYLAYETRTERKQRPRHVAGAGKDTRCFRVGHFDEWMEQAARCAPAKRSVGIEDIGLATVVLSTDHAKQTTGEISYVDS